MKILTINAGSSSMKFSVMEIPENKELINGYFQRIGLENSFYDVKLNGEKLHRDVELPNHLVALECIKKELVELNVVANLDEIDAVGHRVVHGGEAFATSTIITDEMIETCKKYTKLAPLHNPANIACIEAAKEAFAGKPMVAVFDTAFHQTMPEEAYMYALPYEMYKEHRIRKYGFHGTSHKFVAAEAAKFLGKPAEELKIITCHLGNGSSVSAVKNGKCVDTSMGFTPLDGVVMGTRCGSIDPAIVPFIMEKKGYTFGSFKEE